MNATASQQYLMLFIVTVTYLVWHWEVYAESAKRESTVEIGTCYYDEQCDKECHQPQNY